MPRFFFHTADGSRKRDEEGTELADLAAARIEAIRFTGMVLAGEPHHLWFHQDFRVEVTDETGLLLFTIITLAIDAPATATNVLPTGLRR